MTRIPIVGRVYCGPPAFLEPGGGGYRAVVVAQYVLIVVGMFLVALAEHWWQDLMVVKLRWLTEAQLADWSTKVLKVTTGTSDLGRVYRRRANRRARMMGLSEPYPDEPPVVPPRSLQPPAWMKKYDQSTKEPPEDG